MNPRKSAPTRSAKCASTRLVSPQTLNRIPSIIAPHAVATVARRKRGGSPDCREGRGLHRRRPRRQPARHPMLRSLVLLLAVSTTLSLQAQLAEPGVDAAPPARFVPIGEAWAGSSVNVVANRRHALFTSGGYQFAAYYDNDGQMILARRQLGTDHWERQATRFRGAVADAHNAISIAIDGDGFLHVAWDHHGQPLNYARGTEPLGLELGPRLPMTGMLENRVTYPEFHRLPNGDLLCLYRDGQSGRGRLVLNRYRVTSRRWETVQDNLIDGEGERSPYWGATVDAMGRLHLAWIWRETPD